MATATKEIAKVEPTSWKITTIKPERAVASLQVLCADDGLFDPFQLPRLMLPAGGGQAWEVSTPTGTEYEKTLNAVILHQHQARKYWDVAFGQGERKPPTCQSFDGLRGYGAPGGACAQCKLRANGCTSGIMMYLLRPDMLLPMMLWVPTMSVKGAKEYFRDQFAAFGDQLHEATTQLGLTRRMSKGGVEYSVVTFARGEAVSGELLEAVEAYRAHFLPYVSEGYDARVRVAAELANADAIPAESSEVQDEAQLWGVEDEDEDTAEGLNRPPGADDDDIPQ